MPIWFPPLFFVKRFKEEFFEIHSKTEINKGIPVNEYPGLTVSIITGFFFLFSFARVVAKVTDKSTKLIRLFSVRINRKHDANYSSGVVFRKFNFEGTRTRRLSVFECTLSDFCLRYRFCGRYGSHTDKRTLSFIIVNSTSAIEFCNYGYSTIINSYLFIWFFFYYRQSEKIRSMIDSLMVILIGFNFGNLLTRT